MSRGEGKRKRHVDVVRVITDEKQGAALTQSNPRSDIALLQAGDLCLSMKSVSPYRARIVEKSISHRPRT